MTVETQETEELEGVNLQFHWYMLGYFIIYFISFSLPVLIVVLTIYYFYIPYFLEVNTIGTILFSFS